MVILVKGCSTLSIVYLKEVEVFFKKLVGFFLLLFSGFIGSEPVRGTISKVKKQISYQIKITKKNETLESRYIYLESKVPCLNLSAMTRLASFSRYT